MVEQKGYYVNKWLGLLFGGTFPFLCYYPGESIILGATILSLFFLNLHVQRKESSLISVAVTLLGILYIGWLFSFLAKIRCLEYGKYWVGYLIFVTKMGDAAAYFVGKKCGTLRLNKKISPNKTVEGACAGLLTATVCSLGIRLFVPEINVVQALILGFFIGVLAQLGDLAESLIKRDVGVKDSGFIPGLGGVLDILDSLLFTAPFLYYYLSAVIGGA